MRMADISVLLDQNAVNRRHRYGINVFEAYVGEVLAHAGITFRLLDRVEDVHACESDVILVALADEEQEGMDALLAYAARGGTVISYAGLNKLAVQFGCRVQQEIPVGYSFSNLTDETGQALRFLGAKPWETGEALQSYSLTQHGSLRKDRPDGMQAGAALLQFAVGQGSIERWSVNIPHTIVTFQQGTGPVLHDGVPAKDGTGDVDEGILKADDRSGMDWELDRLRTETGAPYFAFPYADLWREHLIGHLLKVVTAKGLTLPFIGYWPDGVRAVATISHDSDLNLDETAETTLNVLKEAGIHTTWCMIEPGYSPHIYERVKQAGHELAFHYNALDIQDGRWDEAEFDRQYDWVRKATGLDAVISNKNHYTRFEGWGELFRWCEKNGIQAEQTRGPSKKGNIGFLFGTCHPYLPIAWFDENNRLYDVLEISFLTQDLDHMLLADSSVAVPFLEQVLRVEGVAHFLFHQVHIHQQPPVTQALRKVVSEARSRGFEFWTSAEINQWERFRRNIRISGVSAEGEVTGDGIGELDRHVVVYIPQPDPAAFDPAAQIEKRFGVPCRRVVPNTAKSDVR